MEVIKKIESDGLSWAHNKKSGARGLYQITPIVLREWNDFHPKETFSHLDLFIPWVNEKIAFWYMQERIPRLLRAYRISDTVPHRLSAYNFGAGNLKRVLRGGIKLPEETKNYIKKYFFLLDRKK